MNDPAGKPKMLTEEELARCFGEMERPPEDMTIFGHCRVYGTGSVCKECEFKLATIAWWAVSHAAPLHDRIAAQAQQIAEQDRLLHAAYRQRSTERTQHFDRENNLGLRLAEVEQKLADRDKQIEKLREALEMWVNGGETRRAERMTREALEEKGGA